ncbi:MAG: hypothetical protein ABIU06_19780, partial [Anaerolineales bacterium]
MPRVDYEKLSADQIGESSEAIRACVQTACTYHRILKLACTIAESDRQRRDAIRASGGGTSISTEID